MKKLLSCLAAVILCASSVAFAQNVSNYIEQGGARTVIGGSLDVVSGGDLDIESGGSLKIGGTAVSATAAEINNIADDSARLVAIGAGSTTASCAVNGTGKINYISSSTDATITLPAATGSGCVYEFTWSTLPAQTGQTGDVIQVTGNDEFRGILATLSDDSAAVKGFAMAGGSDNDKLAFTSSTKYVATKGVSIKIKDIAADVFHVEGTGSSTGSEASPAATGQRS